ncbi:MAG: hypothetical protein J0I48_17815 [Devosia sp.]|uniref:hypothetical protein n=1 Tax=Devosia sp. 66-22 TaxID=1895753 RepID=UPI000929793D|nr:hypothetical protein [Devosia sp. 66-22]MBN9348028.1 hypothetical protein [Devosia sp.]OJX46559.1 MAG: hypothetical protein BGO81_04175 [Devosia sp. 66-22]
MEQGAITAGAVNRIEFDLLKNPFAILRIPLTASKEDVAAAFDDALVEGRADDAILRDARRQLLAPKSRLAATVDFLVDADPGQRDLAISALEGSSPLSDLIALAKGLPKASRASFLSNVAQLRPSSGVLRYFALTLALVDRDQVHETVGHIFENAGLSRPGWEGVSEAFEITTASNIRRLFSSYKDARPAAADMRRCLEDGLPAASSDDLVAFSSLVSAYLEYASAPISELRRRIDTAVETFLADTKHSQSLEDIETSLLAWDELSQPAQLLAEKKGRDEPQARELFEHLRGFMIELANEKDAPSAALRISKVCNNVFAELPRAVAQLAEDLGALQNLVDQEGAKDLIEFADRTRRNLDPLVSDLKGGFDAQAKGEAKRLYDLFDRSVKATYGTAAAELPWGAVRVLALDMNNDLGEAAACDALISGLIEHRSFSQAPPKMKTALLADRHTLQENAAQSRFKRAIEQKDTAGAERALTALLGLAKDDNERRQYQQAIDSLAASKRWRVIKWIFWGVVILGGIVAMANQGGGRSSSSYSTSTNRSASTSLPTPATTSFEEVKPAPYSTAVFSLGNVRYCQFQNARIDALNALIVSDSNAVIRLFNQVVDDYNSRCANYRYREADMLTVQRELTARSAQIASDARATLQRWRASN